jgi:hypothetical protein
MGQTVVQFDLETPLCGQKDIRFRSNFPLEIFSFEFSHSLGRVAVGYGEIYFNPMTGFW